MSSVPTAISHRYQFGGDPLSNKSPTNDNANQLEVHHQQRKENTERSKVGVKKEAELVIWCAAGFEETPADPTAFAGKADKIFSINSSILAPQPETILVMWANNLIFVILLHQHILMLSITKK